MRVSIKKHELFFTDAEFATGGGAKFSQGRPDSPGSPLAPALPYSDKIESFEQIYTQYWTKLISI